MEPTLPAPKPEVAPPLRQEVAAPPSVYAEASQGKGVERASQASPTPQPSPVPEPTMQPRAVATQPAQAANPATNDDTDVPQIADDVDVIEKEWVDKAKKIVSNTKHDPHEQEKQVSRLQADYLMKRYNKQIKVPE